MLPLPSHGAGFIWTRQEENRVALWGPLGNSSERRGFISSCRCWAHRLPPDPTVPPCCLVQAQQSFCVHTVRSSAFFFKWRVFVEALLPASPTSNRQAFFFFFNFLKLALQFFFFFFFFFFFSAFPPEHFIFVCTELTIFSPPHFMSRQVSPIFFFVDSFRPTSLRNHMFPPLYFLSRVGEGEHIIKSPFPLFDDLPSLPPSFPFSFSPSADPRISSKLLLSPPFHQMRWLSFPVFWKDEVQANLLFLVYPFFKPSTTFSVVFLPIRCSRTWI